MTFHVRVDARGIPYSFYGHYRGTLDIGTQISPLFVAENGLRAWNAFFRQEGQDPVLISGSWNVILKNPEDDPDNEENSKKVIENCRDWLLVNLASRQRGLMQVWEYPYQMSYNTPPGWASGHAQVVALQLLARGGSHDHLASCLKALEVSVERGGLATFVGDGIWFEKFAHPAGQKPMVLNGHLFAVLGLFDLAELTQREDVMVLALKGLEAARTLLSRFDLGDWTAYDIFGKRASPHYHRIVVEQLRRLSPCANWVSRWHDQFSHYQDRGGLP